MQQRFPAQDKGRAAALPYLPDNYIVAELASVNMVICIFIPGVKRDGYTFFSGLVKFYFLGRRFLLIAGRLCFPVGKNAPHLPAGQHQETIEQHSQKVE